MTEFSSRGGPPLTTASHGDRHGDRAGGSHRGLSPLQEFLPTYMYATCRDQTDSGHNLSPMSHMLAPTMLPFMWGGGTGQTGKEP